MIPAIDLRGGMVVRLRRGDFADETSYGDDPREVAARFVDGGARTLHLVDLDGARLGEPVQAETIRSVIAAVDGRAVCQVAGGLRSPSDVAAAIAAGAGRVVVGTAALRDPEFARAIVEGHGADRIVCAIDVRDGLALGEGWRQGAPGLPPGRAMELLSAAGARHFAVTAISRDGLLQGPDLELLGEMVKGGYGEIIASGGISSLADLRAVAALGCRAAIAGRALYEGRMDLREAIALAGRLSARRQRSPCGGSR